MHLVKYLMQHDAMQQDLAPFYLYVVRFIPMLRVTSMNPSMINSINLPVFSITEMGGWINIIFLHHLFFKLDRTFNWQI